MGRCNKEDTIKHSKQTTEVTKRATETDSSLILARSLHDLNTYFEQQQTIFTLFIHIGNMDVLINAGSAISRAIMVISVFFLMT